MFGPSGQIMRGPIDLNDNPRGQPCKVDDVWSDGSLSTKAGAIRAERPQIGLHCFLAERLLFA